MAHFAHENNNSFIYSFTHLFVYVFIHLFICSFIHSFIHSFSIVFQSISVQICCILQHYIEMICAIQGN